MAVAAEKEVTAQDQNFVNNFMHQKGEEHTFVGWVQSKVSAKKMEEGLIVVSANKIYEFRGKKYKVVTELHFLDITKIESPNPSELTIHVGKGPVITAVTPQADDIINAIRHAFELNFFGMPEDLRFKLDIHPPSRIQAIKVNQENSPCGGFAGTYKSYCLYFEIPKRDDIIWDMTNLLPANNVKEFNMNEFEAPVSVGDLRALIKALAFNPWFKVFTANNYPLGKDGFGFLADCLRANRKLEELRLRNCSAPKEAIGMLSEALAANRMHSILSIDFSNNPVDEKAAMVFANALGGMSHGLQRLKLDGCGIPKKAMAALCGAFKKNTHMSSSLQFLSLSGNKLESDGSTALGQWLSGTNSLKTLRLASCAAHLDVVLGAVLRGCGELTELDISQNKITSKKEAPHLVKFLQSSANLRSLNVSDTGLQTDSFKDVLKAIGGNVYLKEFVLHAADNDFGPLGANLIATLAPETHNIAELDLAGNDFGDEGISIVAEGLCHNNSLSKLSLARNFGKTTKFRPQAIEALIALVSSECPLKALSLAAIDLSSPTPPKPGGPLKEDLVHFIYALATNETLTSLDITGNQMGDKGAIALGKALQTNHSLKELLWDDNGTTLAGFSSFLIGLERNLTLSTMPLPVGDVAEMMKAADAAARRHAASVISRIEHVVFRNQNPKRAGALGDRGGGRADGGGFGGLQQLLASGEREEIERLRLRLKTSFPGKSLTEDHKAVIRDAEELDAVLSKLHLLREEAHQIATEQVRERLKAAVATVTPVIDEHFAGLKARAMEAVSGGLKSLDSDTLRRLRTNVDFGAVEVEAAAVEKVLTSAAVDEISAKVASAFQSVVDISADYLLEKVLDRLEAIYNELSGASSASSSATMLPPSPRESSDTSDVATPTPAATPAATPVPGAPSAGTVAAMASALASSRIATSPGKLGVPGAKNPRRRSSMLNSAVLQDTEAPPSPSLAKATPSASATPAGNVPPKRAPPKPPSTAPPKKVDKKASSSDTATLADAPMVEGGLTHLTKDRPMGPRKRRMPTRRPRGPATS